MILRLVLCGFKIVGKYVSARNENSLRRTLEISVVKPPLFNKEQSEED